MNTSASLRTTTPEAASSARSARTAAAGQDCARARELPRAHAAGAGRHSGRDHDGRLPEQFPDHLQYFGGAAQCGAERHPRRRHDAADDRGLFRSLGGLDARARRRLGRRRSGLVGLASAPWPPCGADRRRNRGRGQRRHRDPARHQRADRHARDHDDLSRPDLPHCGHRRDADQRQLCSLWGDGRPGHPDAVLGDAGHCRDRRLGGRANPLLPAVLLHRRQCARREALGHPGRASDPHRLHHHGGARRASPARLLHPA